MLAAAEEEAVLAIDEAYAAGYKAGLLASAPDTAWWRSMAEAASADAQAAHARFAVYQRQAFAQVVVAGGAGLAAGILVVLAFGR